MNTVDAAICEYERCRQARAKLSEANKQAVFDALAAANIAEVIVEFDGEGDSGQITSVTARRGEEPAELPAQNVLFGQLAFGDAEPRPEEFTLEQAIESLCYDYLLDAHGGWENNDGGFGEFRLDVASGTVELEFNGRFTDVFTSHHSF